MDLKDSPKSAVSKSYYLPVANEVEIFRCAFKNRLPLLLKGPTGCGKTRFVEYMAQELQVPLISVACHEDLTAADLVGRYLLDGGNTVWVDGPLTRALRQGAICYLDEVVEARADTTVVIHPLSDHRRELYIERRDETLKAPDNFMLVLSYNPGYQSILKDLKPSTRQRMVSFELSYPSPQQEVSILVAETGVDKQIAEDIVKLANAIRQMDSSLINEVASTRTLVSACRLIQGGLPVLIAVQTSVITPLTDDRQGADNLTALMHTYLVNS